jgi:hypothetical protein
MDFGVFRRVSAFPPPFAPHQRGGKGGGGFLSKTAGASFRHPLARVTTGLNKVMQGLASTACIDG